MSVAVEIEAAVDKDFSDDVKLEKLMDAEDKLEELNAIEKAPASWADLGLPPEAPPPPAIPAFLSVAPAVVGGFSVLLYILNAVGLFGEGPDLDALVEEWSKV